MVDNWKLVKEIQASIKLLSPGDQLYLVQRMIGGIKRDHFTDQEKIAREAEDMANDSDIQRVLRGEDLPLDESYRPAKNNEMRVAS